MTLTVSVSELRSNISSYLDRVTKGARVLIRDEKKDLTIAQITPQTSNFDKEAFEKSLRKAAGIFSLENHPEWSTKKRINSWLRKQRLADQRSF